MIVSVPHRSVIYCLSVLSSFNENGIRVWSLRLSVACPSSADSQLDIMREGELRDWFEFTFIFELTIEKY